jgi:predicted nuclease of predicted toxin-antitoxin system
VKFIVDAQLPKSFSDFLNRKGFDCIHTIDLPEKNNTTDSELIKISKGEERVIITKDNDFLESHLILSQPEKLILIRTGSISNKQLIELFTNNFRLILEMIERSHLVEISQSDIAEL